MKMSTVLTTALLGLTLTGALADAGPKARTPQPTPLRLSDAEGVCQIYAEYAAEKARERDQGVPLLQALNRSRYADATHHAAEWAKRLHDDIIISVYNDGGIDPNETRVLMTNACLRWMTQPTTGRDW